MKIFVYSSRAECACNPVRYFTILSPQRSGSGWFETLLNSHINISSNGEIFSVKVRRSNISTIMETLDKVYYLDWLTSASKNECTTAVGLKWMLNQVRRGKINDRLRCLQDIVPRCYKTMGVPGILDEIINYVQSLKNQFERAKPYEAQKVQRLVIERYQGLAAPTQLGSFDFTFGSYSLLVLR